METYIITSVCALLMLLIAALISNSIKFEGGSKPKDPKKRRVWFWVFAILNPTIAFVLLYLVFKPDAMLDIMAHDDYMAAFPIALGVGFVVYILFGFIISKMFKHGKLGHWF
tara:strand:+ start:1619 stop:1954 length:336 start_codon:yes stop_codon:yes gene_type:complete